MDSDLSSGRAIQCLNNWSQDNQIPLRYVIPGFKLFSRKCVFGPRDQYTDYIPDEYRVSNHFIGDGC